MKKLALCLSTLLLLLAVTAIPSALAMETDFTGSWVCVYVDLGDGVLQTEYEGSTLQETIYFDLLDDGTVSLTSFGEAQTGTWTAADNGVTLTLDGMDVVFTWTDGMLINDEDGFVMYFTRPQPTYAAVDYTGDWVCLYVDFGDGEKLTEYEGQSIADNTFCTLNADGTLMMASFGNEQAGTWQATASGVSMLISGTEFPFAYVNEQLVNEADGVTMFFARAQAKPKTGGFNDLIHIGKAEEPAFSFTGTWQAVFYDVSGTPLDIALAFPDGLTLTLYLDGTGFAQITPDYAETLAWRAAEDGIALQSSYLLFGPVWDAESGTLTLRYATDIVQIGFQKISDDMAAQLEGIAQPLETAPPVVMAATEAPIADVTVQPTPAASLPVVYSCDFFSVAFPEGWKEDEFTTYNWDQSYTMQYDLNDEDGWPVNDITISASVEAVATYRATLDTLLKSARAESNNDALDELVIDGITFYGTEYGDYWRYADYTARIPEASVTLRVTVNNPETIADVLADILGSIRFTYPIPDPPLSDPPLPEDGARFMPSPAPQSDGGVTLTAQWQQTEQSLYFRDSYSAGFTCIDDHVYILSDQSLASYTMAGGKLTPTDQAQTFDQSYRFIGSDVSGTLYLSDGYSNGLTLVKGEATGTLSLNGYLSMNPDGAWGLMFWGSDDMSKLTLTADGPAVKPWFLKNLSDDTERQGRFSYISTLVITGDSVFVAGTDATTEYASRIARYDFDGNELAVYGSTSWLDDSALGTVTGIVQTANGILVQDGFYSRFLLFALDGTYIGAVSSDDLLGTSYATMLAMVPSPNGALALVSQEREDHSAIELLVFEITGF